MAPTTRTVPVSEGFRGGIDVRVSLRADAGSGGSAFDGAWFPRSRDLAVELPELIAALERHGVRVERFTYALDAWQPAPRKLEVQGRTVRAGPPSWSVAAPPACCAGPVRPPTSWVSMPR